MKRRPRPSSIIKGVLLDAGYTRIELYPARGHWRTSPYADCYRFEGSAIDSSGIQCTICSWDTMTACVRNGFEIRRGGDHGRIPNWEIELCAKPKLKKDTP